MSDRYTLTRGPDGIDVLHRNQREECGGSVDAARPPRAIQDSQRIDAETADALLAHDAVRRCGHCMGADE